MASVFHRVAVLQFQIKYPLPNKLHFRPQVLQITYPLQLNPVPPRLVSVLSHLPNIQYPFQLTSLEREKVSEANRHNNSGSFLKPRGWGGGHFEAITCDLEQLYECSHRVFGCDAGGSAPTASSCRRASGPSGCQTVLFPSESVNCSSVTTPPAPRGVARALRKGWGDYDVFPAHCCDPLPPMSGRVRRLGRCNRPPGGGTLVPFFPHCPPTGSSPSTHRLVHSLIGAAVAAYPSAGDVT